MIRYESTGRVGVSAVRKIQEEIGAIGRVWWQGALGFDVGEIDRPMVLSGSTKLFHGPGIPDADDVFMAWTDALFILERLSDWSKRFKIKWRIGMNDDDWGSIDPSGFSGPLLGQMKKWARRVGAREIEKGTWVVPGERLDELTKKYKGRPPNS